MGKIDEVYMSQALREASRAFGKDEVPVGAVVVYQKKIIARAHNQVEILKDPTAHAEMIALTSASNYLDSKWLIGASLYVTIEPCAMCAGGLILSRIENVIYGACDPKAGACGSVLNILNNKKLNHRIRIKKGVLEEQCASLLKDFFKNKRGRRD